MDQTVVLVCALLIFLAFMFGYYIGCVERRATDDEADYTENGVGRIL